MAKHVTDGHVLEGIKVLEEKMSFLPLYFHSIGHYLNQRHEFRPNGMANYQVSICLNGSGVFSVKGNEYNIKKGTVFFFAPNVGHEYYPTSSDWTILWVVFKGNDVPNLLKYLSLEDAFVKSFPSIDSMDRAVDICNDLYSLCTIKESYNFSLTLKTMELLEHISHCPDVEKRDSAKDPTDKKSSFAPVVDFIHKNYSKFLTLDDLAASCNLSKSHFCRSFKEAYDITPMAYLNRYRISVAKFLLTTTVENLDRIVIKSGFSDLSYFCAVFRKLEGCSPNQYRKAHRKQQ